ncbi:hypothetical protein KQX54_008345 [Cotesia glomerata]|uniref:Uncharacterized protein n=1 Tax=Cotesia glomerata TaxID=32391 RepID=A0AAV7IAJ0_COTGL|nr:hypothetical protein KQX54_008345 [Cotesia glomerata]
MREMLLQSKNGKKEFNRARNLPIPKVNPLRKRRVVNQPVNMQSEETWNRDKSKQAPRIPYQEGKGLKRVIDKSKVPTLIFHNNGTIKNIDYYHPNCPRKYAVALTRRASSIT